MTEENAYDKFLQNYILYGMSDPNGLITQYQQELNSDNRPSGYQNQSSGYQNQSSGYHNQASSYNNQASSNDESNTKSGQNQQQGAYQQQNSYNNNSNNNYSNNRYNNNSNSGYRNKNLTESQPGDIITQRDTIFIQNLPKTVTVPELEQSFGSIGVIKIDKKTNNSKIWIYKDKATGEGKGEATVTYDDEEAATAAINWFDNKEILGCVVKIQLATRKNNFGTFNKGHRGGGGGFRGEHRGERGGGNRFNDRRNNNERNERSYDRQSDRGDRNQGRGYHSNRSNNNYSRPAPY